MAQKRLPHAVLLAGPAGVGKRAAAAWIASGRLGIGRNHEVPHYPFERPEHADLRWIAPEENRQGILIGQIRELIADLQLTSYEGRGKVAVIEPANSMNSNAANSLLKTLEEPPGDTLIVLVADSTGRLPATIISRCQRMNFAPPSETEGLAWLDRVNPGQRWAAALRAAGNAPLAAIAAAGHLDTGAAMAKEFSAVGAGRASPIDVAERWSKLDPGFVLDWLTRQVRQGLLALAGGRERAPGLLIEESVLQRMDRRKLFCYLDTIDRLRSRPAGSYNPQFALEGLLIDWAGGVADAGTDRDRRRMELMLAER